jgi:hypothetical protein
VLDGSDLRLEPRWQHPALSALGEVIRRLKPHVAAWNRQSAALDVCGIGGACAGDARSVAVIDAQKGNLRVCA